MTLCKLPLFNTATKKIIPYGIDENENGDGDIKYSENLEYTDVCRTRHSRKSALVTNAPDQVIKCNDRLFFRYGNVLKEVIQKLNDELEFSNEYELLNLPIGTDRTVFCDDNKLNVFPDGLSLFAENDDWSEFATDDNVETKFPFYTARTLLYSSGYSFGNVCNDAAKIKIGTKIKFSWISGEIFTVIKTENVISSYEGSNMYEGELVTLDKNVNLWNNVPAGATALISEPGTGPVKNTFYFGANECATSFLIDTVSFLNHSEYYDYVDLVKNYFSVGERIRITGSSKQKNNGEFVITEVGDNYIKIDGLFDTVTETAGTQIKIETVFPKFDFSATFDGRTVVVDNERKKLYISSAENRFVFSYDKNDELSGWNVDLSGECTGLIKSGDELYVFNRYGGNKIFGSNVNNYRLMKLPVSGALKDAKNSLLSAGKSVYYLSPKGITCFSGGYETVISNKVKLHSVNFAATNGENLYFLSEDKIYVYSLKNKIWWVETAGGALKMFDLNSVRYDIHPEGVYLPFSGNSYVNWNLETKEIYDIDGKTAVPLEITIRGNFIDRTDLYLYIMYRGKKDFEKIGIVPVCGETDVKITPEHICNRGFRLRISGKGNAEINNITVKYRRK